LSFLARLKDNQFVILHGILRLLTFSFEMPLWQNDLALNVILCIDVFGRLKDNQLVILQGILCLLALDF